MSRSWESHTPTDTRIRPDSPPGVTLSKGTQAGLESRSRSPNGLGGTGLSLGAETRTRHTRLAPPVWISPPFRAGRSRRPACGSPSCGRGRCPRLGRSALVGVPGDRIRIRARSRPQVIGLAGKVFARRDCLRALGVGTAYVCPDRSGASMSRRRTISRRRLARQTELELA